MIVHMLLRSTDKNKVYTNKLNTGITILLRRSADVETAEWAALPPVHPAEQALFVEFMFAL